MHCCLFYQWICHHLLMSLQFTMKLTMSEYNVGAMLPLVLEESHGREMMLKFLLLQYYHSVLFREIMLVFILVVQ